MLTMTRNGKPARTVQAQACAGPSLVLMTERIGHAVSLGSSVYGVCKNYFCVRDDILITTNALWRLYVVTASIVKMLVAVMVSNVFCDVQVLGVWRMQWWS